jgi:hypothetical protein
MEWPVTGPVNDNEIPTWVTYYAGACRVPDDPTIVWGTDVDVTGSEQFLKLQSKRDSVWLSMSHLLLYSVSRTLAAHPEFNRRIIGRRTYDYKTIDLLIPLYLPVSKEIEVLMLTEADQKPLADMARWLWEHSCSGVRNEFIDHKKKTFFESLPKWFIRRFIGMHMRAMNRHKVPSLSCYRREIRGSTMVNYFGSGGTVNMRAFKPSRFPCDSNTVNVTMGPTEDRAVVKNGEVVVRRIAPVFVRVDHRITQGGFALREFLATLVRQLEQPQLSAGAAPGASDTSAKVCA